MFEGLSCGKNDSTRINVSGVDINHDMIILLQQRTKIKRDDRSLIAMLFLEWLSLYMSGVLELF